MRPTICIIAAVAKNGVIGRDGTLPWHLSEDLRRFKALTMGHPILMGRRTHESIGRSLPGRSNLVLSRDPKYQPAPGAERVESIAAALVRAADADLLFVIGGAAVYAEALSLAQRMELTELDAPFDGDTRFPPRVGDWREVGRVHGGDLPCRFEFVSYERGSSV
jgi:dihydrofolate reductase